MMKLVPRPDFPLLGQWIPFLQQVEETSDDIDDMKEFDDIGDIDGIDDKEIDATDFQEFCTLIDPTEEDKRREKKEFQDSLVPFRPAPPMPPSRYDRVIDYIKKFGLEKNIILLTSNASSGEPIIKGVNFRCLKIKGNIEVNFPTLKNIKFINNEFSTNVDITAIGAIDASILFAKNTLDNFALTVANAYSIAIKRNNIFNAMDMHYNLTLLSPNHPDYNKIKKTHSGIRHNKLFINFSGNNIGQLNIKDIEAPDWHEQPHDSPLGKITFTDHNYIGILRILTKHTTLTTNAKLEADINKTSFSVSDRLGTWILRTGSMPDVPHNEMLTYGRFFSLLEVQASQQHDRVNEEKYRKKARYFYRNFLPYRKDRFIFGWTDWVSKDGTSWIRPLFWLLAFETLLATIAYNSLACWNLCYFREEGWKVFLTLLTWFMNPASLLPLPAPPLTSKTLADSWLIYVLFLFQKASVAVFYYETIKALRRFTR